MSPGAMSKDFPRSRKSDTPRTNASRQWPPEIKRTRKGNSTSLVSLIVSAWASIWWIGMNGLLNRLTSCKLNDKPTPRLRASPGLMVVAMAERSCGETLLAERVSSTIRWIFSLWSCWATGGTIPPVLGKKKKKDSFKKNWEMRKTMLHLKAFLQINHYITMYVNTVCFIMQDW